MPASPVTLKTVLPAFADVPDLTVQSYLDMAERSMGDGYGVEADDAQIFLAAHLMSLAGIGPGAAANQMAGFSSLKVGSLSLSRSEQASAGDYATTAFGVLFWRLAKGRSRDAGPMVTGTGYPVGYGGTFVNYGED